MKIKTINILPIVLALILPALPFYSHSEIRPTIDNPVILAWMYSSLVLFNLWHFIWLLWDIKQPYQIWYTLALFGTMLILIALYFVFFDVYTDGITFRLLPPSLLFLGIQYALKSQQKVSRLLLEKAQLQTENYKAQLKTLRTQVDPHFLFNSLNTLRSMVLQQHSGVEQFILSLSDFYRQTLQHNEHTVIKLSKELVVLQAYLFLMKRRNEQAVQITLDIDTALLEYHIPTMALQTVVENCFKHNSMTLKNPLQVIIKGTDDSYISVCNNIQAKMGGSKTTGLGLELLRKRYGLMNIKDGLTVEQTSEQFCVKLKLI